MATKADFESDVVEPESTDQDTLQPDDEVLSARETPADEGDGDVDQASGPIPLDRHKKILSNLRRKVEEEVLAKFSYVRDRDPQDVIAALQAHEFQKSDPEGYATAVISRHPELRNRLFSSPVQPSESNYPKPVLDQYTGQYYYSADQLKQIRDLDNQAMSKAIQDANAPVIQWIRQRHEEDQERRASNQRIEEWAASLPEFDNLLEGITKEMDKDSRLTVPGAWRRVYERDYLPKLKSKDRETTLSELQTKARANGEMKPSQSRGETQNKRKYSSNTKKAFTQIFEELDAEQRQQR